jgi:hypothetical protein
MVVVVWGVVVVCVLVVVLIWGCCADIWPLGARETERDVVVVGCWWWLGGGGINDDSMVVLVLVLVWWSDGARLLEQWHTCEVGPFLRMLARAKARCTELSKRTQLPTPCCAFLDSCTSTAWHGSPRCCAAMWVDHTCCQPHRTGLVCLLTAAPKRPTRFAASLEVERLQVPPGGVWSE